jgi:hypothetical protein
MKAGKFLTVATLNFSLALSGNAQTSPSPPVSQPPSQAAPAKAAAPASGAKTFSEEELEQLLAPIALYPDELFTQVLMASTYPLDIVMADRWVKANPKLKGKELEDALQKQPWDPSVKSLAVFPQVLTMMSEKIDWTQKLGDAFLAQEKDVMDAAQTLRGKAVKEGTLKDTKEQKVVAENAGTTTIIKVEPTNPEVVYVPTYNPTYVYGAWPYPAYPPYYYYPPGYAAGAAFFSFTAGAIVGGALWGSANWHSHSVNVNVNRYNNFNRTNISNSNWNHNVQRRGAVPYRDQGVAQRYGRGQSGNAAARNQYRGRTNAGGVNSANRSATAGSRTSGTRSNSAFNTGSGAQTRNYSNRGTSSLSSARSSGNFGGGARSFSGGARGGRGGGRR